MTIDFSRKGEQTEVVESFDAETMNPPEMQQAGWQAILDRFKAYAESKNKHAIKTVQDTCVPLRKYEYPERFF